MVDRLVVTDAREHNLKNITVAIPREALVVITGLSGSGKSSLAFDTIYAEGRRRYVESLSAYARQFLEQMEKPEVGSIEGLSPAIAIEQRSSGRNPRSTVGTVTEIYDYLRLLFARLGVPHCPNCGRAIESQTVQEVVDRLMGLPEAMRIHVFAPLVRGRKGAFRRELDELRRGGFVRVRVDGTLHDLAEEIALDRKVAHDIDVLVDRLALRPGIEGRLADSLAVAFRHGGDMALVELVATHAGPPEEVLFFSQKLACPVCGVSCPELTPRLFSFNSPQGACASCGGLGTTRYFDPELVVPDESRSLAGGAIAPWERRSTGRFRDDIVSALSAHYGFDAETPYRELPDRVRKALLHGSGTESVTFVHARGKHRYEFNRPFEGVLPMLDRRYRETDSDWVREELERFVSIRPCPDCHGERLKREALAVLVQGKRITEITGMSVAAAESFFRRLRLPARQQAVGRRILKEIRARLGFLRDVGLDYLNLDRGAGTLSGGEAQRIRLATQIGAGLSGVLYVLDEPSIGLHQRDNERLLVTLRRLRDLGNTVIVVEHDREAILAADHVVDMGPGAGRAGGHVVAEGTPAQVMANGESLTGRYLSGALAIEIPPRRRAGNGCRITLRGARHHNLRNLRVDIPLAAFTCVTGVSGSGKSSLVVDTLFPALAQRLHNARARPGAHDGLDGSHMLDKVIDVDQAPIGRTPRSNAATYTGLFTPVRELFAQLPEARLRGYGAGRFSFNVKGGRCEACSGDGVARIEMHFLPDVYVTCEVCGGRRYNRETLGVRYKGKSIADVLDMTVAEALEFLRNFPTIRRKLEALASVGLDYVRLGQPATTLSGGEAQRVKLARELARRATGKTLYIFDEPTTGLHFHDIRRLLDVLSRLTDAGNTILVIEHNLDVVKTADYVIDLGPEGGSGGGRIVATGTPEEIAAVSASHTGRYLRPLLGLDAVAKPARGRARH